MASSSLGHTDDELLRLAQGRMGMGALPCPSASESSNNVPVLPAQHLGPVSTAIIGRQEASFKGSTSCAHTCAAPFTNIAPCQLMDSADLLLSTS